MSILLCFSPPLRRKLRKGKFLVSFENAALLQFVKAHHTELYGKVVELRTAVENWLAFIPQTFPHYTRHTVQHSDAIILQMSKMLFVDNNPTKPVIEISSMEAYIAMASAYLHDSGMVISDQGKARILATDEWNSWTTEGSGAERWTKINN